MTDMRTLWFKGDEDADWQPKTLHAVDASHALEVDPKHWRAEKPPEPVVEESAADLGVDGDGDSNNDEDER